MLVFPSVQLLDLAGPLQVFATCNDRHGVAGSAPPYAARVIACGAMSITTSSGLALAVEPLPPAGSTVDTLIVAGGSGVTAASQDRQLVDWLRSHAARARRVASVCTGAFMLAEAGLLDGRRAATHWANCAELASLYPKVRVEADPIFVRDGSVWTSAGITAGIDLALALVEEDFGREVALDVARWMVMFLKRPGGQAQFSTALALQAAEHRFGALHDWIEAHLAADLSLPVLAKQAGMSERSFSRHYNDATGLTPARAVERLRLEAARRLLIDAAIPIKRIATLCGFGSEETLRRSFLRLLAVSPQDYRARWTR